MAPPDESRVGCYFRSLHQIAVALNCGLELSRVLDVIVQTTAQALAAKACSIMVASPSRRQLCCAASYGLNRRALPEGPVDADPSAREVLSTGASLVLDGSADPTPHLEATAMNGGAASILCAPMRLRGEAIGVLRVYTADPRAFSPQEIDFAEATATLGATALENAAHRAGARSHYDLVARDPTAAS